MKKKLLLAGLLTTFSLVAKSQVGINTSNPQGVFNIDGLKNNPSTGVPTAAQAKDDLVMTSNGNLGLGLTAPGTTLDVNGAITNRETALAVAGNAVAIPTNVSLVRLTGAATANVAISAFAAPNPGQRLIVYNNTTGGFGATLDGTTIPNGKVMEFIFSNSFWRSTEGGAAGANPVNIYTADGTLAGNRTVTQGANTIAFTGTQNNAFSVDGNTLSVDAANNRVGIGTTTPDTKLTISTPDNSFGLNHTNGVASLKSYIGGGIVYLGTTTANDLRFTTNNTEKMSITSAGDVGIGTATPDTKLTISTPDNSFGLNHTNGVASLKSYIGGGIVSLGTTTANDLRFTTNNTQKMSITSAGDVGIGTTTPDTKLTIRTLDNSFGLNHTNGVVSLKSYIGGGAVFLGTSTANDLRFTTNNTARISVTPGGNVGISTSTPTEMLDVSGGNLRVRNINTNTSSSSTDKLIVADANGVLKTKASLFIPNTSVVGFRTTTSSDIAANTNTPIIFTSNPLLDKFSYNSSTGVYTALQSGYYQVSALVTKDVSMNIPSGGTSTISLWINGSSEQYIFNAFLDGTDTVVQQIVYVVYLNANDTLNLLTSYTRTNRITKANISLIALGV